jgi:hypothetical protein
VLGCVVVAVAVLVTALATRDPEHAPDVSGGQAENLGGVIPKDSPNSGAERPIAKGATSFTDGTNFDTGELGGERSSYPDPEETPSNWAPVLNDEALPCTASRAPVNFETYSVGPSINGRPLTYTERRCGAGPVAARVNYLAYIYGDCSIRPGESGCRPPLEIQTWPACQRFLAKYSFRSKPLPHRFLSTGGGAEVVEFSFAAGSRIEVYTKASTVVIFAADRDRALEAVDMLRHEENQKPPAISPEDLREERPGRLIETASNSSSP